MQVNGYKPLIVAFCCIDENNIERFLSLLKEMIYALLAVSFYDSNFIIKAQPFYVG